MPLSPYSVKIGFSPIRLRKGDEKPVRMSIHVKNLDTDENLTSVVVEIPREIGFDKTGFVNRKEIRVGKMEPSEDKTISVDLFSHSKTEPGTYNIRVIVNKHYRGYSHVIANTVKDTTFRVVK